MQREDWWLLAAMAATGLSRCGGEEQQRWGWVAGKDWDRGRAAMNQTCKRRKTDIIRLIDD